MTVFLRFGVQVDQQSVIIIIIITITIFIFIIFIFILQSFRAAE